MHNIPNKIMTIDVKLKREKTPFITMHNGIERNHSCDIFQYINIVQMIFSKKKEESSELKKNVQLTSLYFLLSFLSSSI